MKYVSSVVWHWNTWDKVYGVDKARWRRAYGYTRHHEDIFDRLKERGL